MKILFFDEKRFLFCGKGFRNRENNLPMWIYRRGEGVTFFNSFQTTLTSNPEKLHEYCSVAKRGKHVFECAQMLSSSGAGGLVNIIIIIIIIIMTISLIIIIVIVIILLLLIIIILVIVIIILIMIIIIVIVVILIIIILIIIIVILILIIILIVVMITILIIIQHASITIIATPGTTQTHPTPTNPCLINVCYCVNQIKGHI